MAVAEAARPHAVRCERAAYDGVNHGEVAVPGRCVIMRLERALGAAAGEPERVTRGRGESSVGGGARRVS